MSSVIYYWTDARQHGIYLLNRELYGKFTRQRPLARWFHPQLWLVHLNLSARWQQDPQPQLALKVKWTNQSCGWNHLASGRCRGPVHERLRKAEEANLRQIFRFSRSLSAAEVHVFGVKFNGLCGTVVFIAIRDFFFWGESDLWSDVWPAMDGVVCLSILLEGRVTVSNKFTKRPQNGSKIGTRDKFATHLREEKFISNEIVIYTTLFRIGDFPIQFSVYTSCRIHHVCWAWGACDTSRCTVVSYCVTCARVFINNKLGKKNWSDREWVLRLVCRDIAN